MTLGNAGLETKVETGIRPEWGQELPHTALTKLAMKRTF